MLGVRRVPQALLNLVLGEHAPLSYPSFLPQKQLCENREAMEGQPEVRRRNYNLEALMPRAACFPACTLSQNLCLTPPLSPTRLAWLLNSGWPWLSKIGFKGINRFTL